MTRAVVQWACTRTIRLYKELTCLSARDGSAILGSEVPRKHRVTTFAAVTTISYPCSTLLPASPGTRMFAINELGICWGKNQA